MLLRVSNRKGMWGYGYLWFTYADPKPQNVDLNELDAETKQKVLMAVEQGDLVRLDKEENKVQPSIPLPVQPQLQQPIVNEEPVVVSTVSPVIARKLTELLKNGVTTLRREIPLIKSYQSLSAALRFEKEGKNRKTVVDLIGKMLEKTGNTKMYDEFIEEEDLGTVTFKVEDIVIESESKDIELDEISEQKIRKEMERM